MANKTKMAHVDDYTSPDVDCCTISSHSFDFWERGTIRGSGSSTCVPGEKRFDIVLANTGDVRKGAKLYIEYDDSGTNPTKPVRSIRVVPAPVTRHARHHKVLGVQVSHVVKEVAGEPTKVQEASQDHVSCWRYEFQLVIWGFRIALSFGRTSVLEQLGRETGGHTEGGELPMPSDYPLSKANGGTAQAGLHR